MEAGRGGLLLRMTSKISSASVKEGVVVEIQVVPGGREGGREESSMLECEENCFHYKKQQLINMTLTGKIFFSYLVEPHPGDKNRN